jgi:hypothetical protein
MGDVVDGVIARHVLLLQEEGGMALALGEDGNKHIGARHLLAARRLHMDHRALDDALESGRGLRILALGGDHLAQFGVDVIGQAAAQHVEIDVAGLHDGSGILVVGEREQQVLERRIFVAAFVGQAQGAVERLFETAGECRHWPIPFPSCTGEGACCCGRSP